MRILLLADIHSNWPALSAIREEYDVCLMLGDLVDYSTDPDPCVRWSQEHATLAIRGNHDHAVVQRVAARGGVGLRNLAAATRPLQWELLQPPQMKYLSRLPLLQYVRFGTLNLLLVHATPRDPLDEYLPIDKPHWSEALKNVEADIICVGHTHIPFELEVDNKRVINPGSVGQPRDGDPRASYAILDGDRVEFRRVKYDIDATLRQMAAVGVEPWAIEMNAEMLRNGGRISSPQSAD